MAKFVYDNTKVEVGKMYRVRCAQMQSPDGRFYTVPIIGKFHRDLQFGFSDKHYHFDGRFTSKKNYFERDVNENGKSNHVVYNSKLSNYKFKKIVWKLRKCRRLTTGLNLPKHNNSDFPGQKNSKYWNWYEKMIGKSCKGRKCPHLGQAMFKTGRMLVCPLHNLHGDLKTEKIIYPLLKK